MIKDPIIIRIIFSGILVSFGIFYMLYTIIATLWKKIGLKKELKNIKNNNIQNLIQTQEKENENIQNENLKKEINHLLKNIYFDLYKKHKNIEEIKTNYGDIEIAIDHLLDYNILNIIEEKEKLLQEKDKIISMLEEKNENFVNEIIAKISYLTKSKDTLLQEQEKIIEQQAKTIHELQEKIKKISHEGTPKISLLLEEKEKLLQEKDKIIKILYNKLKTKTENKKKENGNQTSKYIYREDFINVNDY